MFEMVLLDSRNMPQGIMLVILIFENDMAGSNEMASCGTLWLQIENNSNYYR